MAAVTIHSDLGPQEKKIRHRFYFFYYSPIPNKDNI